MLSGATGMAALTSLVAENRALSQETAAQAPQEGSIQSRWFFEPRDNEMISWLALPRTEQVLDAGCGRGNHLSLFSEQVVDGHVTGVDLNPERIADIEARVKLGTLKDNISGVVADVQQLPMKDGSYGCVWSSHTMHILPDPIAGVRELARVCRKGGRVVVREDRFLDRLLPFDVGIGAPGLEERAVAAFAAWFVDDRQQRGKLPHGWLGILQQAGLKDVTTKSFLYERQPPFTAEEVAYLRDRKIRGLVHDSLSDEDKRSLEALADEQSPFYAFNRNDLHFVSVSTVYVGWKA